MNNTLTSEINKKYSLIRNAVNSKSLEIFTVRDITHYLYIYPDTPGVKMLMELGETADISNATLSEAAGILRVYVEMNKLSTAFASHLEPALEDCISKIENACHLEGNNLTLSENGTFLSVIQAIEIGDTLLRYGDFTNNNKLINAGKYLISSYLNESTSFDLKTLSELYPVIIHNNSFYPHFQKLFTEGNDVVWAWTCANDIKYEKTENELILNVTFPYEHTHYIMLRGIKPFNSIYIYNLDFRTDPRFESYNSSGYIYKTDTKALLLKSRHKSEKETIRLVFTKPAPKPEETEPEETGTENTEITEETTE